MPEKGKFFVICGTDGSGKGTQTELLITHLKKKGYAVEGADFPRYGQPSCFFVEKYLNGGYGAAHEVNPKAASLFYALDRYDASFAMRQALESGHTIVSNRYVSANQGHQASKLDRAEDRAAFVQWINELEYGILGVPRPDLTLFLHMPPEMGQKLVEKKTQNRAYLKGGKKKDIHEADIDHLRRATQAYQEMVEHNDDWRQVECMEGERVLTREEMAERIWKIVEPFIKEMKKDI